MLVGVAALEGFFGASVGASAATKAQQADSRTRRVPITPNAPNARGHPLQFKLPRIIVLADDGTSVRSMARSDVHSTPGRFGTSPYSLPWCFTKKFTSAGTSLVGIGAPYLARIFSTLAVQPARLNRGWVAM